MKTAMLLQTLENQLNRLRQHCARWRTTQRLAPALTGICFTRAVRCCRPVWMRLTIILLPCVAPLSSNNSHKSRLAEHLASQLEAISRETASWSLREWDSASPGLARWQRKRVQHQEFERRLVEMTRERKERLAQATGFEEQQNCIVK